MNQISSTPVEINSLDNVNNLNSVTDFRDRNQYIDSLNYEKNWVNF